MPGTGPRAPARTLVAVRAIVPVTQMPPNSAEAMLADALRDQLAVGAVPAAGHAVGDHGREQALDAAEQRESHRVRQHRDDLSESKSGSARRRQASRDAAEPVPIVSTCEVAAASRQRRHAATAISSAGQCGRNAAQPEDDADGEHRQRDRARH